MTHVTDRAPEDPKLRIWMAEYQAGNADAFRSLHDALAPDLRAFLAALSRDAARADDLLQDTFLQLHRARAVHTPGEPVRPWAFAIAKRVFLMYRRSTSRRERHEGLFSLAALRPQSTTPTSMETDRLHARQQVHALLLRAPADGRRAFVLHHLFGFSFKEIGATLGIRPEAAKIRSSRAASFMRALLCESVDD
jgi:RNA polymerase sigma-70 factor (ECF subfamily)